MPTNNMPNNTIRYNTTKDKYLRKNQDALRNTIVYINNGTLAPSQMVLNVYEKLEPSSLHVRKNFMNV